MYKLPKIPIIWVLNPESPSPSKTAIIETIAAFGGMYVGVEVVLPNDASHGIAVNNIYKNINCTKISPINIKIKHTQWQPSENKIINPLAHEGKTFVKNP